MDRLEGIWRLIDSRAWDEHTERWVAPYGARLIGLITFSHGRMLTALCNGELDLGPHRDRNYSSYGGPYTFDGSTLETLVDVASDASRIGSRKVLSVVMVGEEMLLRPPARVYGNAVQLRELVWERVWCPSGSGPVEPAPQTGSRRP
jgi:hypothetical protein